MTVEQTNSIDAIGVKAMTGDLCLTISDHLEWGGDENEHFLLLQQKLNTYLRFIESGEMVQVYPDSKGRSVVIDVVCKYAPSNSATGFFLKLVDAIDGAGVKLSYRQLD